MGEVVQLKRTKIPRSRDAFYQAIPVNEIQGRFFYFGRQKMSPEELFKREHEKADRVLTKAPTTTDYEILYDPRYGVPGPLAYRLWTGIEKLISDLGSDIPSYLGLSMRQLSGLAGRSVGGKTAKEIAVAIEQLKKTTIKYWYEDPEHTGDDGKPKIISKEFSLLKPHETASVADSRDDAPHFYRLVVSDIVLGFLYHDRYFFCMSWDRVKELPPQSQSIARILYRYMSYRYSKAKTVNFVYTKDYATMCREWFGDLTPGKTISEIKRKHLAPRFDPIIETGLLASYTITHNKAKDGFNVSLTPGKDFFTDFSAFYNKQLPLDLGAYQRTKDSHLGQPHANIEDGSFALLHHFYNEWFGENTDHDFLNAEIEFARSLFQESQLDESKKFITWSIAKARETKFDMQTFNALKPYRAKWKKERSREEQRLEKMEAVRAKENEVRLKSTYESQYKSDMISAIDALSENERLELTEEARRQLSLEFPDTDKFMDAHVVSVERRIMSERLNFPDYDTWKKDHS